MPSGEPPLTAPTRRQRPAPASSRYFLSSPKEPGGAPRPLGTVSGTGDFSPIPLGPPGLQQVGGQTFSPTRSPPGTGSLPAVPEASFLSLPSPPTPDQESHIAMIPTSTPAVPPSLARARSPGSYTRRQHSPAHSPRRGSAPLTLVEADLVPQDHHALRQQLVLEGARRLGHDPEGALGVLAGRAPTSPPPAAKARPGRDSLTPPLPPAAGPEPHSPWEDADT